MNLQIKNKELNHASVRGMQLLHFAILFSLTLFNTACGKIWNSVNYSGRSLVSQGFTAAWFTGGTTINQPGQYGTQNVGSTANSPGSRNSSTTWNNTGNNFWVFGGYGNDGTSSQGYLNDLWKFSPSNNEWTWVSGSNTVNHAGVYGTLGTGSTNNYPGTRISALNWTDSSGNLWLFGGQGYDSAGNGGNLSDVWEFSPGNGKWTWVSGPDVINQGGVYGTQGTGSTSNYPGARDVTMGWTDSSGNMWLFGGSGYDSGGNTGLLNDLWEFNPTNLKWTWIGGSNTRWPSGTWGTQGVASPLNIPGYRGAGGTWVDSSGNFWLFGGGGSDSTGAFGDMNDIWMYNPTSGNWTWESGSNIGNPLGTYGQKIYNLCTQLSWGKTISNFSCGRRRKRLALWWNWLRQRWQQRTTL